MSEIKNRQNNGRYDLEERTAKFGEDIIMLCQKVKLTSITEPIIRQLIRAATSIGANYLEANGASSKKDFLNKIFICKKESQETRHWLRMLAVCYPEKQIDLRKYWQEAKEFAMIFHKIANTSKNKSV